jgi:hypothetical protein
MTARRRERRETQFAEDLRAKKEKREKSGRARNRTGVNEIPKVTTVTIKKSNLPGDAICSVFNAEKSIPRRLSAVSTLLRNI